MNLIKLSAAIVGVLLFAPATPAQANDAKPAPAAQFELVDGDRVVFLGNTLFERAQRNDYIEAALTSRFPDRDVTFRNLGWSGDTVWCESRGLFDDPATGYQRMLDHIKKLEPTVIFLGYGGNESFAGEEGLTAFQSQLEKLLNDLAAIGNPRFVIVSPLRHEQANSPLPDVSPVDANLERYAGVLRSVAENRGCAFVDLLHEFPADKAMPATENGMHLNELGYRRLSGAFERLLHQPPRDWELHISADAAVKQASGGRIENITTAANNLRFDVTDELLPLSPIEAATAVRSLHVDGLAPGKYTLLVDGEKVQTAPADAWARGVPIESGPPLAQFEALRRAIIDKNELYFHHWRPQNFTYLFGFRKHEQGQNAPEVDEFLKLVAEKEAEIAKLRVPAPHKYELVREEVQP